MSALRQVVAVTGIGLRAIPRRLGPSLVVVVGMACVVASGPLNAEDIIEWSRDQMANYKVPRAVEIVDELPLNATGKVMKDALRERAAATGHPA